MRNRLFAALLFSLTVITPAFAVSEGPYVSCWTQAESGAVVTGSAWGTKQTGACIGAMSKLTTNCANRNCDFASVSCAEVYGENVVSIVCQE